MLAPIVLSGCGHAHPLMPLRVGSSATYEVKFDLDKEVAPIKTVARVPVAGVEGYELAGPLGVSRVAWKGNTLYADRAANAAFEPSMPILTEDAKPRTWRGVVTTMGKRLNATATLEVKEPTKKNASETTVLVGNVNEVKAYKATLTITLPKGTLVLDSWYSVGLGLVKQEQRTNGSRVVQLAMQTEPDLNSD